MLLYNVLYFPFSVFSQNQYYYYYKLPTYKSVLINFFGVRKFSRDSLVSSRRIFLVVFRRIFLLVFSDLMEPAEIKMEPAEIKLFVGGVSHNTNEQTLRDYFSKYGELRSCDIIRDRITGLGRGFGFIVFADSSVVEHVLSDTHVILGKKVIVWFNFTTIWSDRILFFFFFRLSLDCCYTWGAINSYTVFFNARYRWNVVEL